MRARPSLLLVRSRRLDKGRYWNRRCAAIIIRMILHEWVNSLTDGERWSYGLAAVTLASIFAAPAVTHRLAARRDRWNAKRHAAATFRATVLSALNGFYPLPFRWPDDITSSLSDVAPTLQSAVAQFRPFVPWRKRRSFDRAWFNYRCATGREMDSQCYHHYIAFSSNPEAKKNFRRNVDALLNFAK